MNKDKKIIVFFIKNNIIKLYDYKLSYNLLINELREKIPRDKLRKVCKECNELGHDKKSTKCKINIDYRNNIKNKIYNILSLVDPLEDIDKDELIINISNKLNISNNLCYNLYKEIPVELLLKRDINVERYLNIIKSKIINCFECNEIIYQINSKLLKQWKNNVLCNDCWYLYEKDRNILWNLVYLYKPKLCEICNKISINNYDRYHYDHINIFNKSNNIFDMVNNGEYINDIYNELDKCQCLCISCHQIITDIEIKLGFIKLKTSLNFKFNNNIINKDIFDTEIKKYSLIYDNIMKNIYIFIKNNL